MMEAVAVFERALILERQCEGIAKAMAIGTYTLAREFGISRETVYIFLRAPER